MLLTSIGEGGVVGNTHTKPSGREGSVESGWSTTTSQAVEHGGRRWGRLMFREASIETTTLGKWAVAAVRVGSAALMRLTRRAVGPTGGQRTRGRQLPTHHCRSVSTVGVRKCTGFQTRCTMCLKRTIGQHLQWARLRSKKKKQKKALKTNVIAYPLKGVVVMKPGYASTVKIELKPSANTKVAIYLKKPKYEEWELKLKVYRAVVNGNFNHTDGWLIYFLFTEWKLVSRCRICSTYWELSTSQFIQKAK